MIHKSSIINKNAIIEDNVKIGPYCIIGPNVKIGKNSFLHSNIVIEQNTQIGENCEIFPFTTIGYRAQDLNIKKDFFGNTIIKNNVVVREQVSIHASTKKDGVTEIGNNCFLMATSHIAHDCKLGDNVIMANSSMLAGHVNVSNNVFISGGAAIHQFTNIGELSFIIACSRTVQDVPPYSMTGGASPTEFAGINVIGLRRANYSQEERTDINKAYKILYKQGMKTKESFETLINTFDNYPHIQKIIDFIKLSERGIIKKWKGRRY